MQTSSDDELKAVFNNEDMLDILLETGFRIPMTSQSIQNREDVVSTLKDHYSVTRVRHFLIVVGVYALNLRLMNFLMGWMSWELCKW